ncbi:TetR/AcrR family transcriptional regulator [Streptomyces phaeochromogenes]|uniref:TetR/AcrR family transcriptional regulator n=1 Tax=Streptomyces phaeochromogenes TaxID=1923 RepID=UPI003689B6AF
MASTDKTSTRDRLLDAAMELFYREGVSIGVEALCRAAGVSKRSMYQLYAGKDEVLVASLERRAPEYARQLALDPDDTRPPRARILHIFELLEQASTKDDYCGCPFLSAMVELKNPEHPASVVALRVKGALTEAFRVEAERGGARDPQLLARQLTLVFDGASARAGAKAETLNGLTTTTATALLDAAGVA